MDDGIILEQTVDQIGFIRSQLQGLRGYDTLLAELLQNADDANTIDGNWASTVSIDVRDEALVIRNDGVFSECDDIRGLSCSFADSKCDVHGFRRIANSNKANDSSKTGRLGIGFTSVYQLTDSPIIASGTFLLRVTPSADSNRWIFLRRSETLTRHTEIEFPWAFDPKSPLRLELPLCRVPEDAPDECYERFRVALRRQIVFLKHISRVSLSRNGRGTIDYHLTKSADLLTLQIQSEHSQEQIAFLYRSQDLADDTPGPENYRSEISVALPLGEATDGLLYNTLPTEISTETPFSVNADFVPTPDRKGIVTSGNGPDSNWNRMLLKKAAALAAELATTAVARLPQNSFWRLIRRISEAANQKNEIAPSFSLALLKTLKENLPAVECVELWDGTRCLPPFAIFKPHECPPVAESFLHAIGLPPIAEELRQFRNTIASFGAHDLTLAMFANKIAKLLPSSSIQVRDAAPPFDDAKTEAHIEAVLQSFGDKQLQEARPLLRKIPVTLIGECWYQPSSIFAGNSTTEGAFAKVFANPTIFSERDGVGPTTAKLSDKFNVSRAIEILERMASSAMLEGRKQHLSTSKIFAWFAGEHEVKPLFQEELDSLAALPIVHTRGITIAPKDVVLTSEFEDAFQLATVFKRDDFTKTEQRLLQDCGGATPLDLAAYVKRHLVSALEAGDSIDLEDAASYGLVVHLLGMYLAGDIIDAEVVKTIRSLPIVLCANGHFRQAHQTYRFDSPASKLLHDSPEVAWKPSRDDAQWRVALGKVGARDAASPDDLQRYISGLEEARQHKEFSPPLAPAMIEYLAEIENMDDQAFVATIEMLSNCTWLPASADDQLHRATDLCLSREHYLSEHEALFVGFAREFENQNERLLQALGVRKSPSTEQIVRQLLRYSKTGDGIAKLPAIYNRLNDTANKSDLDPLREAKCILVGDVRMVRPDEAFWENPLGPRRWELGESWRKYRAFCDNVGVKQRPEPDDAALLLVEIADASREGVLEGNDDREALRRCWAIIGTAENLSHHQIERQLADSAVILNAAGRLIEVRDALLDDDGRYSSILKPLIEQRLVALDPNLWQGYERAGAARLSAAVKAEPSYAKSRNEDIFESVIARIRDRQPCIERLLMRGAHDTNERDQYLLTSACWTEEPVRELWLNVSVAGSGSRRRKVTSYLDGDRWLINEGEDMKWEDVATEIARTTSSTSDRAVGLGLILQADTRDEAHARLDGYGYPALADLGQHELISNIATLALNDNQLSADSNQEEIDAGASALLPNESPPIDEALDTTASVGHDRNAHFSDSSKGRPIQHARNTESSREITTQATSSNEAQPGHSHSASSPSTSPSSSLLGQLKAKRPRRLQHRLVHHCRGPRGGKRAKFE